MNNIKLFKLNSSYKFYNIFNELIMFIDSVESPITRDITTIDITKIVIAHIVFHLYKKEVTISCYIENDNYYSIVKE